MIKFRIMKNRFQQTDFWCDFKCAHGWQCVSAGGINILTRTFKKLFSISYVPLAPEKSEGESDEEYIRRVGELTSQIKPALPKTRFASDTTFRSTLQHARSGILS